MELEALLKRVEALEMELRALRLATGIAVGRTALHGHPSPTDLAAYWKSAGIGITAASPEQDREMLAVQTTLERWGLELENYVDEARLG